MNTREQLLIDLHIHTTCSDGSFTPEQAVDYARRANLAAISITDHDTTDGIERALIHGARNGIEVIPGVELSVQDEDNAEEEIHILGYFIDWKASFFQQKLEYFRSTRRERARKMHELLSKKGVVLDLNKLLEATGTATIGRMHFARALQSSGYISNTEEAFEKYIGPGRPAFVPKVNISAEEAIQMLLRIGGIPVIAHPMYGANSRRMIKKLVKAGIKGIEVYHPRHGMNDIERFKLLADEFDLVITGGSDCHGGANDRRTSMSRLKIPYDLLLNLKRSKKLFDKQAENILESG